MEITLAQVKSRLALLEMTLEEFAAAMGVSYTSIYKAAKGDPFMHKLRKKIPVVLERLERRKQQAA